MVWKRWEYIPRRIPGYDYSQPGFYFVTISTRKRRPVFRNRRARSAVVDAINQLPQRFPTVSVDRFVCMPDHMHLLLQFDPPVLAVESNCAAPPMGDPIGRSFRIDPLRPALGQVVRAFKAVVTRRLHRAGFREFAWQPNYFEWVVRSERALDRIREYIVCNPFR
ncbi:MAG TPA: transposase [Anaerolineales bacterium]